MKEKIKIKKKVKLRDFSRFSAECFNAELSGVNWNVPAITGTCDVDNLFSSFYNKFNKIVNKYAPLKALSKRKAKQLCKPWITKGLSVSIRIKNKLYASGDISNYKVYRNKICSLMRISKQQYYFKFFNTNLTNMKKTWEGINNILGRKWRNAKPINSIQNSNVGNTVTSDPSEICNIFNSYFASVGSKLAKKLPPARRPHLDFLSQTNSPESSFVFDPVTPEEVKLKIGCIPNYKSHGLYSCPPRLLKCSANVISSVLADMINSSILNGVYPSKLKMAKIVPVYKADDDTDVNNYQPISLLSHFNRIFEKMIKRKMESFIEQKDLLSSSQYGFRKAHSTQHAILDIVNAIQTNMDKQLFSCGVFIDLKKAFDTVDHSILLHKLDHYGFCGVINKWFSSYLLGRTQTTQICPHVSSRVGITCGVPQGSVLGPLLFLLNINDIYVSSDKLNFFIFADDTNILYANKNLKSLEQTFNQEFCKLYIWLTANKLTLNI